MIPENKIRIRHDYKRDKDRLKRLKYWTKSIITQWFLDDEYVEKRPREEHLFRYKNAKYITNPDSFCKI